MSGDRFTHFDEAGRAAMVDVSAKPETARVAVARGRVVMTPETLADHIMEIVTEYLHQRFETAYTDLDLFLSDLRPSIERLSTQAEPESCCPPHTR